MEDSCASPPYDRVIALRRQSRPASHVVRREGSGGNQHAPLGRDEYAPAYRTVYLGLAESLLAQGRTVERDGWLGHPMDGGSRRRRPLRHDASCGWLRRTRHLGMAPTRRDDHDVVVEFHRVGSARHDENVMIIAESAGG
jgi:hypothetical protein